MTHANENDGDTRGAQVDSDEELTETVHTAHGDSLGEAETDVVSDPAHNDHIGSDWVDEGGATA